MKNVNDKIAASWDETADSDWYNSLRTEQVIKEILEKPQSAFHQTTWKVIHEVFPDLNGVKICVPSSGDNQAVFAFAALGAKVVSCDISQRQLWHAERIAKSHGLAVEFSLQNTMELSGIRSGEYDLVYISEGVHVWIDDLLSMYRSIYRILKPGGAYINYELHPINRPIKDDPGKINIAKPYSDIGPFHDKTNYHWRMQDIINAIASSGLIIKNLQEMFDEKEKGHFWFYSDKRAELSQDEIDMYYDWRKNPQAALPQWFSICAIK